MNTLPFPARRVLFGVTGSIAAVDAPATVLALRHLTGAEVRVVATAAAATFVTPKALAVASGNAVMTEEAFRAPTPEVPHISLTSWADLVVVWPATADVVGKAAHGLATDPLTTCLLAATSPVVFVPSMNGAMWDKPAVQRNVATLRADGHGVVPPVEAFSIGRGTFDRGGVPPVMDVLVWIARWWPGDDGEARPVPRVEVAGVG